MEHRSPLRLLVECSRGLEAPLRAGLREAEYRDVRPAHYAVFRHLRPEGSRVTELAEAAGLTQQSMGEFAPGTVALLTPVGSVRRAADGVEFPNCRAVSLGNSTLLVAESYGNKLTAFDIAEDGCLSNRRVWADLGVPDGICRDAEGAVWYGDVPNKRCVRVAEGGEVLQTIELNLGCFACMMGVRRGKRCLWWRRSGVALRACPKAGGQVRC